jgi:putative heme-binding domain-containing protein
LSGKRADLENLARDARTPLGRQAGWAALVTADASVDQAWHQAESNPARLIDLLLAIPWLREADLRAAFYSRVEPLVGKAIPLELRRAAITALPAIPGHEAETFRTLAGLVDSDTDRAVAIASLQRIPRAKWPAEAAGPLVESLLRYLQALSVEQRTTPEALDAFQFATDLGAWLSPEKVKTSSQALRELGVSVFVVHTLKEQMLYDKTLIVVEAGKPMEIVLINDDAMPHNLVVVAPGALEEIGQAAEKLPLTPDSQGRLYIPDSPKILHATKLVEPGQQAKLAFTAPEVPGDYPYVCTFPGHWRRMTGTLAVVKNVEAYLASHPVSPPKVTPWKLADLAADLDKTGSPRDLLAGRALFTQLACVQCHKIGASGYAYGPDLTEVFKRWQGDRARVLEQILEPSKVIEDRYRPIQFLLKDGDDVTGLILKEEAETVTVQTGASESLIQTLKKSGITERRPQSSSVMPVGLLNALTKDQILDLLAFLEAGGTAPIHEHAH